MTLQSAEEGYHYGVIRRAIELIDDGGEDIGLEALAAQMSMSPAHFQRVFSAWVGVSPKRYQQYLRLGHAKTLLQERFSTLETAHAVGLSGSGRLHDLFLRWEAMSPGEYARKGAGLRIRWGWFDSPFGLALVMGTEKGICGLAFAAEIGAEPTLADMRARWPQAEFVEDPMALRPMAEAVFAQKGEAALHIPSGYVTTYSELAHAIGSPRAVRAVGTAVGKNPVSWLIPCHRALRKSGALGGYHWGTEVKRAMLAFETARGDGLDRDQEGGRQTA